jgi:hypothetical protein
MKRDSKTKGFLGMVVKKDGSLATRFSDLLEDASPEENQALNGEYVDPDAGNIATRYETQLILRPGEYDVWVALGDGTKFGRAETPLAVESHDGSELVITKVALCKQIQDASAYSSKSLAQLPVTGRPKSPAMMCH